MVDTIYTQGFKAGLRYQRESTLDFIRIHAELNVEITVEDIANEITASYKRDMEALLAERKDLWGQKR
jgi:hypothetical protein